MLVKAGSAPAYLRKGLSAARAGRIVVLSFSITNSTRSPLFNPRRLRISRGTVICPLLLMVLEGFIFTFLLYSKDTMFYLGLEVPVTAEVRCGLPLPPSVSGRPPDEKSEGAGSASLHFRRFDLFLGVTSVAVPSRLR